MSPYLIELLGTIFHVPPNVFEAHLKQSGYVPEDKPTSKVRPTWQSRPTQKGYSSMTWYRPAIPVVPLTTRLRTDLLSVDTGYGNNAKLSLERRVSAGGPVIMCPFGPIGNQKQGHKVRLATCTNIWRSWLELCPSPGVSYRGSKLEYPVGWEERATTWIHRFHDCKISESLATGSQVTLITNSNCATRSPAGGELQCVGAVGSNQRR